MKECIKLHLIGPSDKMDGLMKRTLGSSLVSVRPHVIYQWLCALREFHDDYSTHEALPDLEQLKERLRALEPACKDDAFYTTDEDGLRKEKASGDDVAQVRTSNVNESANPGGPDCGGCSHTETDGECTDPLMGQTYIANRDTQQGGRG